MPAAPAFAVIATFPTYCPSTDAFAGMQKKVVARFHTLREANDYVAKATPADEDRDSDDASYEVKVQPYRKGEDQIRVRNLLEERNDQWAKERDAREEAEAHAIGHWWYRAD